MKQINLYSDGSSLGNPGAGGWGTILEYNAHTKEFSGGKEYATNNQMELKGVIEGLKQLKEPCNVKIISDSKYVVQAINEWLSTWQKNGFKTSSKQSVKNYELWIEYLEVSKPHKIEATWIKGHSGHIKNERCDILAKKEAVKFIKKDANE